MLNAMKLILTNVNENIPIYLERKSTVQVTHNS